LPRGVAIWSELGHGVLIFIKAAVPRAEVLPDGYARDGRIAEPSRRSTTPTPPRC
jgi:hypothetical protein